jgi:predicted TIM-barrel fold metal-dependent hydrolase
MIIDSHAHIFSPGIIANVSRKTELVELLHLEIGPAAARTHAAALKEEARAAGVDRILLLPTATEKEVRQVNDRFLDLVRDEAMLFTAGTAHPGYAHNRDELLRLKKQGIRMIKLCSFSQGFDLEAASTRALFDTIDEVNRLNGDSFAVVLDTFYLADRFFGTPPRNITTPERLARLADAYPDLLFVGAHMGGLAAPFEEIVRHLTPRPNLFLGTSNAAHTLSRREFVTLLEMHGPERILFGTDWPWFGQKDEMARITDLLEAAGFHEEDRAKVFCGNICRLTGMLA